MTAVISPRRHVISSVVYCGLLLNTSNDNQAELVPPKLRKQRRMENDFPVFDPQGNMLGNTTSLQGVVPTYNAITNQGPFQSSTAYFPGNNIGNSSISNPIVPNQQSQGQGGVFQSGIQGSTVSIPGGTSIPNTVQTNPTANATGSSPSSGLAPGSLADYFARAIIIVLGFIFIAVGLNMLRPGTVPVPSLRR